MSRKAFCDYLKLVLALVFLISSGLAHQNEINLTIVKPRNHETINTKSNSADLYVTYRISSKYNSQPKLKLSDYNVCVEVTDTLTERVVLRNSCTPVDDDFVVSLYDVPLGDFIVSTYIILLIDSRHNQMISGKELRRVVIAKASKSISTNLLEITSYEYQQATNTMTVVAPYQSKSYSVVVTYNLLPSVSIPRNELEFCVKVIGLASSAVPTILDFTCVETDRTSLTFSNFQIDDYIAIVALRRKDNSQIVEFSQKDFFLSVKSLEDAIPNILFPSCVKTKSAGVCVSSDLTAEGVIASHHDKTDVSIIYELSGYPSSLKDLKLCVDVYNIHSNFEMLGFTCFPSNKNRITLNNIQSGHYLVNFVMALSDDESVVFSSSKKSVSLDMKHSVEFVPTYEWQPLHVWHTIPNGLETRLPLDMNGRAVKEARIPTPWRFQIAMPDPCKYFLRMNVYPETRIEEILHQASIKCGHSENCFEMHYEGERFEEGMRVDETNLFNIQPSLIYKPACL